MTAVDHDVGEVELLAAFLDREQAALPDDGVGPAEQQLIVEQARTLLADVYVHGPAKQATEAYDVDRALRALDYQLDDAARRILDDPASWAGGEWRFHQAMLRILGRLRDFHTRYVLPERYRRTAAFLPFLVERAGGRFVVTKVNRRYLRGAADFAPGAVVEDWNGVPIHRAVELVGEATSGGNEAARFARGLEALTIRPLDMNPPPDERWVVVGFRAPGARKRTEVRVPWRVLTLPAEPDATDPDAWRRPAQIVGIDPEAERTRRVKRRLLAPAAPAGRDSLFSVTTSPTPRGDVGYLRIWSFDCDDAGRFVRALARELDRLPPDGLVVDVRGNGGGNIVAAEAALQLLTPVAVVREGLQFLATAHTRAMAPEPWVSSIDQAGAIGERYSLAHPLAEDDEWAQLTALGQRYQGPKVLIVDALSYSATDIFAAGWQDNAVGPVVGTDARTGAGGANVWSYRVVRQALREGTSAGPGRMTLPALPGGASLRVAVRRSLRVGPSVGTPLEGLGVAPGAGDVLELSLRDALGDPEGRANVDLVAAAAERIAGAPRPLLLARRRAAGLRLTTRDVDRVDVVGADGARASFAVSDPALTVPAPDGPLRLEGFAGGRLRVTRAVPGRPGA